MQESETTRAVDAARAIATSLGLPVDDAIVLQNSNKLAVRLVPCDVLARVGPAGQYDGQFEIDLATALVEAGCPVGAVEPRVDPQLYRRDGFAVTFWTYHHPVTSAEIAPADYAETLRRLHVGMRAVDFDTPHFTDRVGSAQRLIATPELTPDLGEADRQLLEHTLHSVRASIGERAGEQLLHGEPHPGNLLSTTNGPLFIDLETCCRGPVEFDVAHAPDEVGDHYPGLDHDLLRQCRILQLAMITSWRWDREDQLPDGRRLAAEWLAEIRKAWP